MTQKGSKERIRKDHQSKDGLLETKAKIIHTLLFSITVYLCESCTVKKAGGKNIGLFEIWCWRRALEIPWTPKKTDTWVPQQIKSETFLEAKVTQQKLF